MTRIDKAIAAFAAGAITWATSVIASAPAQITASEWIQGAGVLVAAYGVWRLPNKSA